MFDLCTTSGGVMFLAAMAAVIWGVVSPKTNPIAQFAKTILFDPKLKN